MRAIDADKLGEVKFHSLPYTHITPSDVEAESYKRGWNDAIDSIIEDAPTIEPERKKGKWIDETFKPWGLVHHPYKCDQCGEHSEADSDFCPSCGADMREDTDDQSK